MYVTVLQPQTTKNPLEWFIIHCREHALWTTVEHLSKRVLERMRYSIWGYDFGEGLKKQGFAVDWLLSGSGN